MGFECKTVQVTTSSDQYYSLIHELMNKYPMKSIHRAHRYAAFKEISNDKKEFNVLFNGYLGGELLMGIYPDNLVLHNIPLNKSEYRIIKIPLIILKHN